MTQKSKGFCFTINNPNESDLEALDKLKEESSVLYLVWGTELGESGTLHYQGFVRFKHPITFDRARRLVGGRGHIEVQKGTSQQAADYCKKDGIFVEHGELPRSAAKTSKEMWRKIIEWAENGEIEKIKDEYPHAYFLHRSKIISMRKRESSILGDLLHEWWVGPTGTGKSRKLWAEYPEHFPKSLNKWWDGYADEDTVAIEEMTPAAGQFLAHYLKIWADRYPFSPEIKGGTLKKIRPKKIIVLSNYTIEECFPESQDNLPLKRRFKVVNFNNL